MKKLVLLVCLLSIFTLSACEFDSASLGLPEIELPEIELPGFIEDIMGGEATDDENNNDDTQNGEETPHVHEYTWTVKQHVKCNVDGIEVGTCECGDTQSRTIEATGHSFVVDAAVEANCENTGLTEGQHCEKCGHVEVAQEVIPYLHGEAVVDDAVAPTCTETGLTEGSHCSLCDAVLVAQEEVAALGHTEEVVPGVAATCTEAGITDGKKCSVCGVTTVEQEEVAKLGHIDENLDIDCDREGCTGKIAPAADSTLPLETANHLGSKLSTSYSYYVEGTIVEVLDAKNGVFYISDETEVKFYFRLPKNEEGVTHANWDVKLVLGDKVRVYGKINKFSSTSAPNGQYYPSIQSGVVTILEQHPHVFGEPTCIEPGYCACGQVGPEALGHNDGNSDTLCDRCQFNVTLTVEVVEVRTDNNSGVKTDTTYTWSGDTIDVIVTKGTSSQLYSTAKDHMRIYKGNTLTFDNKTEITIKSIVVYLTNATQVTNFEKMLTGFTYTKNAEDFTITIEYNSAEDLVLTNTGSTTQVKAVEIQYKNI